jgi:hypothetical protein
LPGSAQDRCRSNAVEDLERLVAALSCRRIPASECVAACGRWSSSSASAPNSPNGGRGCASSPGRGDGMLFICEHHQPDDRVVELTIQDARSSSAATQGQCRGSGERGVSRCATRSSRCPSLWDDGARRRGVTTGCAPRPARPPRSTGLIHDTSETSGGGSRQQPRGVTPDQPLVMRISRAGRASRRSRSRGSRRRRGTQPAAPQLIARMSPGGHPFAQLEAALARAAPVEATRPAVVEPRCSAAAEASWPPGGFPCAARENGVIAPGEQAYRTGLGPAAEPHVSIRYTDRPSAAPARPGGCSIGSAGPPVPCGSGRHLDACSPAANVPGHRPSPR